MRIALAQINPVVGDLLGNADRIHAALAATEVNGKVSADLLVTPELSLWGYPPRDLLFSAAHLEQQQQALTSCSNACTPNTWMWPSSLE